jgi:hypothetical protein
MVLKLGVSFGQSMRIRFSVHTTVSIEAAMSELGHKRPICDVRAIVRLSRERTFR